MMERAGKTYRFRNGYSICKCKLYNGYEMDYFWVIWMPTGEHYMTCHSYEEAKELATNLK